MNLRYRFVPAESHRIAIGRERPSNLPATTAVDDAVLAFLADTRS
ncbi:MAG: hypothetical protein ACOCSN_07155 [Halanaeroarchaeum sp.]